MRNQWVLCLLFFPLFHCAGNTGLLDSDYSTIDGRIAFVGPGDFTSFKIFVIRPDGEGLMRLTSEKGGYTNPSWSPNARRIVFASNRDALGNFSIYIFNLEDRGIQKVVDLPGPDLGPAWSPDGQRIAFEVRRSLEGQDDLEHRLMINADGTDLHEVSVDMEISASCWSPRQTE
ncbi:MAG: PD40 domain-containing protein [Candidatus Latescibacteria bacterium]|nr:PD40 domain-containing protein [Candidatus Latescibacterota bacterium]